MQQNAEGYATTALNHPQIHKNVAPMCDTPEHDR